MSQASSTPQALASERQAALAAWALASLQLAGIPDFQNYRLMVASDDASFRRYFRATSETHATDTYIFVDAPPEKEDSRPFVQVQAMLAGAGLAVPRIYRADLAQGFMMLADFGDTLYLDMLADNQAFQIETRYQAAFQGIRQMQQIRVLEQLPVYDDAKLRTEMALFTDWFLAQQLALVIEPREQALIQQLFDALVTAALSQPQVFVHRDYHCRNLMVIAGEQPGIIDFQDAVRGPLTYDLVSLLKDCYHQFPRSQVVGWVNQAHRQWMQSVPESPVEAAEFLRWFDLMGMQRHLKCAGIFSRLNLRDGKTRYLNDIPLVLAYIVEVCGLYPEFTEIGAWLSEQVLPRLDAIEGGK